MAEFRVGRHRGFVVADAIPGGHDGRELGDQAAGLANAGLTVAVVQVGVVAGHQGYDTLQDVHGVGIAGAAFEDVDDRFRQGAVLRQEVFECLQLCGVRQMLIKQQVGDFLIGGAFGQIFDQVAPVNEFAGSAIHMADFCARHRNAAQSGVDRWGAFFHDRFLP